MPDLTLEDSVLETTDTTGGGTAIALLGAQTGYKAVRDRYADGDWVPFVVRHRQLDGNGTLTDIDELVCLGKITYGTPDTLARTHILSSSNGGADVDLASGTKDVFVAPGGKIFGFNLAGAESRTSAKTLNITHCNLLVMFDTSGGAITQALPDGDDIFPGYKVSFVKTAGANGVTLDPNSTDQINGADTHLIEALLQTVSVVWTGSEWVIMGEAGPGGAEVGDTWYSYRSSKVGWLLCRGQSIGSAASGADEADDKYEALFKQQWNDLSDSVAPVSGGRGASAQADWDADKTLTLVDERGRVPLARDNMGGASANVVTDAEADALGDLAGEEEHTLTQAELASHPHGSGSISASSDGAHQHDTISGANANIQGVNGSDPVSDQSNLNGNDLDYRLGSDSGGSATNGPTSTDGAHTHGTSGNTANAGSGNAHNNKQPYVTKNCFIKY